MRQIRTTSGNVADRRKRRIAILPTHRKGFSCFEHGPDRGPIKKRLYNATLVSYPRLRMGERFM